MWTTDKPTVPGFYWCRFTEYEDPTIIEVYEYVGERVYWRFGCEQDFNPKHFDGYEFQPVLPFIP